MQSKLLEFHEKFQQAIGRKPYIPDFATTELRCRLMQEELDETKEALLCGDLVGAIDGICDLLYVTFGTAVAVGVDIEPFFNEVHRSNMTKANPDGTVTYRADGKVIKPPTYSPADISGMLNMMDSAQ